MMKVTKRLQIYATGFLQNDENLLLTTIAFSVLALLPYLLT